MPAYANADGKVVLFFQDAGKFKYRYRTLGFQDAANLDEATSGRQPSHSLGGVQRSRRSVALVKKATPDLHHWLHRLIDSKHWRQNVGPLPERERG